MKAEYTEMPQKAQRLYFSGFCEHSAVSASKYYEDHRRGIKKRF
jgi:hypothetical protein